MNVTEKLFTPLSDDELDHLDNFLLDRVDDADDENRDEGVLGVSELDGFLTAIASGPEEVGPSLWLPAVWGDCEPVWESESQLEEVFTLMLRHMNVIATHLMDEPDTFEPIFLNNTAEEEVYVVVDEWCAGYLRGLSLTAEKWREGGDRMEICCSRCSPLAPMRVGMRSSNSMRAKWKRFSRPSPRRCAPFMPSGSSAESPMARRAQPSLTDARLRESAATTPARAAVARSTRTAACTEPRPPDIIGSGPSSGITHGQFAARPTPQGRPGQ